MNINELKKIINIKLINNINENTIFDYFRIVRYQDDKILKQKHHILFFPITIYDEELKDGWYINSFDNRLKINDIVKNNPNYYFAIEEDMIKDMPIDSKYIVVDNIMESINKIFNKKLKEYKGKIICVTGSIGKTTTVGFIKESLGDKAIRVYSKRITPLILENFVINYLTNNFDYFVVETALWYKEHMTYFSKTLNPDLVVLLDIFEEHIGVGKIKTISDITKFKSYLLEYANNVLINNMDKELQKLNIKNNYVYYEEKKVIPTKVKNIIRIEKLNKNIIPYIKTNLSLLEETIAYEVAKYYGIDNNLIIERLNKAHTVENRVVKRNILNHIVIFDGDVSGIARFNNFANHYYDKSCLIICNLTEQGEEDEPYEKLDKIFNNFNYVYINKDLKKYFNNKKIIYFDNLDFIKNLPDDVVLFIHYGSYYRIYDEFDIKKLEKR